MAFDPVLNLADLNGNNGFRMDGVTAGDRFGTSVSSAGDINGDGFDDLIIGADGADPNGTYSGSSYVVFGSDAGFSSTLDLSALNGSNGFRIDGAAANDLSGVSVSRAGDVNGDGFDDLIIGARLASPNGTYSGSSYVVFGSGSGFSSTLNLSTLTGSNGFRIDGVAANDRSGASVSSAGDVNGDGFDDLIIGAYSAAPNGDSSGSSYVVFGSGSGFNSTFNLSSLTGSNGFRMDGVAVYDRSGRSVSSAGDINGDGFDDLIIGAYSAAPNGDSSGSSYVVFGSDAEFSGTFDLSSLTGSNGFRIDGVAADDRSGGSVSSAGDINGDGFDDLIIGARLADPNGNDGAGSSYVVFGSGSGFSETLDLSTLTGSNGFRIDGVAADDRSGGSVSSAGDVNGDGFDDLIIGANGAEPNGSSSGSSYVVFGRGSGFRRTLNLSSLNGRNGFRMDGVAPGDFSGDSVSSAGDINGDGFDDLIIGATFAEPNGSYSGSSYVVFGRPALPIAPFRPDLSGGTIGRTVRGDNTQNLLRGSINNDTLFGIGNGDTLYGLQGNDVIVSGGGNDLGIGSFGNDLINGAAGSDTLRGDGGNDFLLGGTGNDSLLGGLGSDLLVGGQGADTLVGGGGQDYFRYSSFADGNDVIRDFAVAADVIDLVPLLSRTQFSGNTALQKFDTFVTLTQVGANTRVFINSAGNGGTPTNVLLATLEGVTASTLTASNFAIL